VTFQDRLTGYLSAMWKAGIEVHRDWVVEAADGNEFTER